MTAKELKQTIRAEIERRMFDDYNTNDEDNDAIAQGVCAGILSFINSLPDEPSDVDSAMKELDEKIKLTKERGSWKGVDVDKFMDEVRGRESDTLEEAAENHIAPIENDEGLDYINFSGRDIKDAFIAGAEWQRKQDQETIELAEDHAILAGMNKEREGLMKGAVEGQICGCDGEHWVESEIDERITGKEGDKVKILIIKDDDGKI